MNMKRFGALALCAALSLSLLAGCKSGDPADIIFTEDNSVIFTVRDFRSV